MDPGKMVRRWWTGLPAPLRILALIPCLSLPSSCKPEEKPAPVAPEEITLSGHPEAPSPPAGDPAEKITPVPPRKIVLSDHPKAVAAATRVRASLDHDLSYMGLRLGDPIFIRAFKEEGIVELFVKKPDAETYRLFRTYPVAAASGALGPKLAEGDGQVPEGFYSVAAEDMNPDSRFNLSFNVGFPNAFDQFHNRTGSLIMLHGNQVSTGCLAMTDAKIDEIFTLADAALRNHQSRFQVHFFPFRMTPERMEKATGDPNEAFWKNLREGYDLFEKNGLPPKVEVQAGSYVFR